MPTAMVIGSRLAGMCANRRNVSDFVDIVTVTTVIPAAYGEFRPGVWQFEVLSPGFERGLLVSFGAISVESG
jgi:hypothetical protein